MLRWLCWNTRASSVQVSLLSLSAHDCTHRLVLLGYKCVMHVHSAVVEVTVKGWVCLIDRKTGKPDKEAGRPRFVRQVPFFAVLNLCSNTDVVSLGTSCRGATRACESYLCGGIQGSSSNVSLYPALGRPGLIIIISMC
jgi:hypothetical protein